ncbi:MAG: hypothetical protein DSY50_07980 [Desulfobulbus sp.]|nr:MAG: hypothetical protein DSY50_07980 [Desulfobulbus sp.]
MGLFDFFKQPQWKSGKSSVRLAAVQAIQSSEISTLLEIIRDDPDDTIRLAALAQLEDRQSLEKLLSETLPEKIHLAVSGKLEKQYTESILDNSANDDASTLLSKITDQQLLAEIAALAESVPLRLKAVEKIHDPLLLTSLLQRPCGKKPALAAIKKISDPDLLEKISQTAASKAARHQAALKLQPEKNSNAAPLAEHSPAPPRQADHELDTSTTESDKLRADCRNLCDQIEQLCENMCDNADESFASIVKQWPELPSSGANNDVTALEKEYQELCIKFSTTRKAFLAEHKHFAQLGATCEQVKKLLRKDNLAGAETLLDETFADLEQTTWQWVNSTDIAQCLIHRRQELEQRKDELNVIANREDEQLEEATALCEKMEQFVEATERFHLDKESKNVSARWRKLSDSFKEQHPELVSRFHTAREQFQHKQQEFYKEQEWQRWNNKNKKEELCQKVAALHEEENLHLAAKKLKEYQTAWKSIGPVPQKDSTGIWKRFKTTCDEIYAQCQEFYTELDQKRQEITAVKEKFCELAEEHSESTSWKESADFLKDLQKQWKAAGSAERDKEQELYTRFRKACDAFFDRRSIFYAEQDALRQENLTKKEALCLEVEELVQTPAMDLGKKIQAIQKQWKQIGPVPRRHDEKIWKRFRAGCDSYFNWLDAQRQKNLRMKTTLCELAEALIPAADGDPIAPGTIDTVIGMQKQWKTIGPVPREKSDELWQRFTGTCDLFFVDRKRQQEEQEKTRHANLNAKEEILRLAGEAMALPTDQEITDRLKELQQQWKAIGPAPREHEQILWDEFHGLCNAFFQKKREQYLEKNAVLEENLKKKEELCFQLERITGQRSAGAAAATGSALDLVEQFKIAREANFMLAGKTTSTQKKREEVRRIQQEWKKIGPTFREQEQRLWKRYRKAIDVIYTDAPDHGRKTAPRKEDQAAAAKTSE